MFMENWKEIYVRKIEKPLKFNVYIKCGLKCNMKKVEILE